MPRKTALWKDVWRSIAHSKGRFVAIFMLMLLGSFALVGLFVAGPDMRETGQRYFDDYRLADLTVVSDYGLDKEDVATIKQATGTDEVEFGYFKDVTVRGTTDAVRVLSEPADISQLELVDGHMPSAKNEIAIDSGLAEDYPIGSTIKVTEKANELNDSTCLTRDTFKVVGHVNSPEIISIVNMGQSTAGTGTLKGYACVQRQVFDSDVFMTARLAYTDTRDMDPYSNEYRDAVADHKDELEKLLKGRPSKRLATVKAEAQEKIDDGQAQVDDAKAELNDARQQLGDVKAQLDDGAAQIADGQAQIASAQAQVDDGAAQIASAQTQIENAQAQLDAAGEQIIQGQAELDANRLQLDAAASQLEAAQRELASAKDALNKGAATIDTKQAELDAAKQQVAGYDTAREQVGEAKKQIQAYDDGRAQVAAGREAIAKNAAELDAAEAELDSKEDQVELMRQALPTLEATLESAQQTCTELENHIAELRDQYNAETSPIKKKALEAAIKTEETTLDAALRTCEQTQGQIDSMNTAIKAYDDGRTQVAAGREEIAQKTAELDAAEAELDAKAEEVEAARVQVAETEAYLDSVAGDVESARAQIGQGEQNLTAARNELNAKNAEYEQGVATYNQSKASYEDGLAQWEAAATRIAKGRAEYNEGVQTLSASRQTLAAKASELASARSQLASARETLASKMAEYQDGLAEYTAKKAEYDEKLPDAEEKIADVESELKSARDRLAKLSQPTYDTGTRRETLGSEAYRTYDTVSEIVDSLARVFPVLLYLVAALVTLSTMTRMVDEERINSGTLKALGYSDSDIVLKFTVYGALAGGLGTLAGIALGHTLLPWIVYSAYGDAFTLPPIHLGFHPLVSLVAIALAGLCSVLPALIAARRELAEKPARLLLPKPPAGGSKIMLERIGFVWERMSFTHKVTARNLFRYKQRMLMTVLGVAGASCMLVAGFGVQHSIQEMADRQFGDIIKYDMIVANSSMATDAQLKKEEKLLSTSDVKSHVKLHYESVTRAAGANGDTQEITLLVPRDSGSFDDYVSLVDRKSDNSLEVDGDGAVISERLANLLGIGVGDTFTFSAEDGTERSVKVSGVCEMYMGHFIYMSRRAYESCYGEDFDANAELVCLKDSGLKSVEKKASAFMQLAGVKSVVQNTALQEQVDTVVDSLDMIMTVLIIVSAMLAVVIMYNLTNLNVSERMRELSTIKVLGFHSNETTMYIYRETICLTALGILAGYVLGVALHQYILDVVPPDTVMFNPELAVIEFAVPAVVICTITIALFFVELRRLSRVDMLEALKSVE